MLDNGADLRHIQEMLGHASTLITQLYTDVSRKKLSEVYEATHPSAKGGAVGCFEKKISILIWYN